MSSIDSITDDTLELLNIERNILWALCNKRGIHLTAKKLREMARQEQTRECTDHPYGGDPDDIRFSIEKYDE